MGALLYFSGREPVAACVGDRSRKSAACVVCRCDRCDRRRSDLQGRERTAGHRGGHRDHHRGTGGSSD